VPKQEAINLRIEAKPAPGQPSGPSRGEPNRGALAPQAREPTDE